MKRRGQKDMDTVEIIRKAVNMQKRIVVIVNNRAGGNGPALAQEIMKRFL